VQVVKNLEALPAAVAALVRHGDLVITLGAGSIGTVGDRILDELRTGTKSGETPTCRAEAPAGNKRAKHREGEGG